MALFKLRNNQKIIGKLKKIPVGVLMGGLSSERQISLKSGGAVIQAFRDNGLKIKAIDIRTNCLSDIRRRIKNSGIKLAFIALHGRFGEDGGIQRLLDDMGIRYTGSGPKASLMALDKARSLRCFKDSGLRVPRCEVFKKADKNKAARFDRLVSSLGLPLVVKPCREGSSIGLSIVDSESKFSKAVKLAFRYDDDILIERYIRGRELTVGILDDSALPIVEIKPSRTFFDYKAKYTKGFTEYICPAPLERAVAGSCKRAALAAHKALGCSSFSRVDIILGRDGKPYVLEVNTIPGLTPLSLLPKAAKCLGLNFFDLCVELLRLAYEKKKR